MQSLQKAGEASQEFGVDINLLLGYVSAITKSTRESGTVVGNSLKTMFSRVTMDESQTKLKEIGIAVKDTTGELRPLGDIYGELAVKWNTLSKAQQTNIALQLAGRFHLVRFLALMGNYQVALDAQATAQTSLGSAIEENYKHQRSLESQINRLTASAQELAIALGNSGIKGAMGGAVGVLTTFVKGLTEVTEKYSGIAAITGVVLVALQLLNIQYKKELAVIIAKNAELGIEVSLKERLLVLDNLLTKSGNGLSLGGFKPNILSVAMIAIGLIVVGLTLWQGHVKKIREEQEMLNKTLQDANDRISEIKTNISAGLGESQDIFDLKANITKLEQMKQKVLDLKETMGQNYNPKDLSLENKNYLMFLGVDVNKAKTVSELITLINSKVKDLNTTYDTGKKLSTEYVEGQLKYYDSLNKELKDTNLTTKQKNTINEQLKNTENDLKDVIGEKLLAMVKEKGLTKDVIADIKNLIDTNAEKANLAIQDQIAETLTTIDETQKRIDEYNREINKIRDVIAARRLGKIMENEKSTVFQRYAESVASGLGMDMNGKNLVTEAIINESEQGKKLTEAEKNKKDATDAYETANTELNRLLEADKNYKETHGQGSLFSDDGGGSSSSKSAKETLEAWESVYDQLRTDYQNTAAVLSRKIDLGVVSGLEVLEEKLNLEEDKLNNIFGARTQLTEDLATWKQKLTELDNEEHDEDYLRQRKNILTVIKQITAELETQNQKEEWQVKLVNNLKKEFESIETPLKKFNDIIQSGIDSLSTIGKEFSDTFINVQESLDLNSLLNTNAFGDINDLFGNMKSSLVTSISSATKIRNQIENVLAMKRAIIDVNSDIVKVFSSQKNLSEVEIKRLKEAKAKLQEMNEFQVGTALEQSGLTGKLQELENYYKEFADYENSLTVEKNKIKTDVDELQSELDALEEQEKEEDRLKEIEDAKLVIQEKQVALQEKMNALKEIENEIEKVKLDKRFEFITAQGQRILTYDTSKVTELEEDKTSAQTDVKDADQEVLDAKQALKDKEVEIAKEKEKELLQLQIDTAQAKLDQYDIEHAQEMEQFVQNWISKHEADLNYFNDLTNIFTTGYNKELEIYKDYWKQQQDEYAKSIRDAYQAGSRISAAFAAGKSGGSMPSTSFSSMTYNPLESTTIDVPMPSLTNTINQVTVVLNKYASDKVMSVINSFASLSLASNS